MFLSRPPAYLPAGLWCQTLFARYHEDYLFGQADNTLVIYCSDHGDYMADHGLWRKGLPCFRGAYEIP